MKIGILGAGQLARMMILESKNIGFDFVLFCPEVTSTTRNLAEHVVASFTDKEALQKFCQQVDVITFESENIPEETIDFIREHNKVYPPKKSLLTAQDRLQEKNLCHELDIPTNQFKPVASYFDVLLAAKEFGLPLILKSRRFGYDGKLQHHIRTKDELTALKNEDFTDFMAESYVPFSREISLISVRNLSGEVSFYDLCQNKHEQGILRETTNICDESLFLMAQQSSRKIMDFCDYVGVLALEFFVHDGRLIFNEMAPRVHNSGHWTIEGAYTSQFENHIRSIAGLPLGNVKSTGNWKMINCIGEMPNKRDIMSLGGFYHDYQKSPREKRKLGHTTFLSS